MHVRYKNSFSFMEQGEPKCSLSSCLSFCTRSRWLQSQAMACLTLTLTQVTPPPIYCIYYFATLVLVLVLLPLSINVPSFSSLAFKSTIVYHIPRSFSRFSTTRFLRYLFQFFSIFPLTFREFLYINIDICMLICLYFQLCRLALFVFHLQYFILMFIEV